MGEEWALEFSEAVFFSLLTKPMLTFPFRVQEIIGK